LRCLNGVLRFTTPIVDPCYNYNNIRQSPYEYSGHNDSLVEWRGWYRLYLNGKSAQMSEWCVSRVGCGGDLGLYLNGSHPRIEDGVVTREVFGSYTGSFQCGGYRSESIQVKACLGNYYIYKLVKPNVSNYMPSYCAVAFQNISSDPCYDYESLDRPWRANNESGEFIWEESFLWNGWYRLLYYGMDIRMPETCVGSYRCNAFQSLSLSGLHPQIEDGVVVREVQTEASLSGSCVYKSKPIRVKACPGNYYVYELVNPQFWCSGYCTDVNTISMPVSTISPNVITGSSITLNYDPCTNYNILNNNWRSTVNYWHQDGYMCEHDDTLVNWHGWYRLFINGLSAQMPEWCVSYMMCGGFAALWLGGAHPQIEDGVVTREVYGSYYYQESYYRSDPIQVKACPGNYYVYKFTRPNLSIPAPTYCAVLFTTPNVDPCYNYTTLDEPRRSTSNSYHYGMCDYNVKWNGWYRLFIRGQNAQMPESCVNQNMCGTAEPFWLSGSHPQLQDGVVTRHVCVSSWNGCCGYTSHPIQVKACPGNYYVYEFVRPMFCGVYYATPTTTPLPKTTTTPKTTTKPTTTETPTTTVTATPTAATPSTSITTTGTVLSCLLHHPLASLWVFISFCAQFPHCGCCGYTSHPIQVKACPGNYYVYEFVRPMFCGVYYAITATPTRCSELSCSEDEHCGEKNGVYGCLCNRNHYRPHYDSFDFSETCESSSGSMSVSRCQLFEAGFSADILHLNDPSCKGTVRNGRVEFHFDYDEHICGTNLVANGTHFIYDNFILGTPKSEGLISREKVLKLSFSCAYPQKQTLSMNMEISSLESIVHKSLPAGEGRYRVRMISYQDNEFTRPFTGSVDAELNQEMHVEVRVEGVDSRQFALVMDTCWATPVNDPDYTLRWDLIVQECPNPKDDTVELLQNGISTSSRFSFRMFIFTANYTKLYLHCAVHLCLLSSNHCSPNCNSGQHWRKRRSLDFHDSSSISMGPLIKLIFLSLIYYISLYSLFTASSVCASLMVLFVFMMSVLILF
uniref:ZP domain-containing protein n=1 Tax=Cyprinus carpio TaxID=7962 RepID=A0A8C2C6S5_CYPCA